ncbi:uncharacterized protein [Haliotis cracherodii]|uniref:uncharacterized protein isoform X2 n=1 Tax=Haliotis cracherodii TaxID=6455 RepID=UPI0039EC2505
MEITHHTSKMSSDQEEHGVKAKRAFEEYPLGTDTEDGIPISKFKKHEGKKPPRGQMQGQEEVGQEIVNGQPEQQDTKSPYHYFKHFHVIKPSGRHEYELDCRPSEVMSPFIEQILKNMTTGSSTHTKHETLRIFQDIVTSPESVTTVFQISSVTYVFILVESSTDKSFTVTPEPSPKNVLALIYDARNKRFVLVLQGKIEESKKWKNEILITVFDMMLLLYRKVNTQGITDIPCNIPNCSQILEALCSVALDAEHRDSTVRRNISEGADKDKRNKSSPVQAMKKMSITNGEQQQQQLPQQQQQPQQVEHDQQTPRQTGVPSGSGQRQQPQESVEVDLIQDQGSGQRQQPPESVEVALIQDQGEPDKPHKDTSTGKFQNSKIISDT